MGEEMICVGVKMPRSEVALLDTELPEWSPLRVTRSEFGRVAIVQFLHLFRAGIIRREPAHLQGLHHSIELTRLTGLTEGQRVVPAVEIQQVYAWRGIAPTKKEALEAAQMILAEASGKKVRA